MFLGSVIVLAGVAWSTPHAARLQAAPQIPQSPTVADFSRRVTDYVDLAKKATEGLPPLRRSDDPTEIASREIALGTTIRAARTGARPGDVLTPETAKVFRRLVKTDFQQRTRNERRIMLDEVPHFHPNVNQTYPSQWPLATFPATLLVALPPLPDGLEYRLLSEALILRDVKANIIVDFILDVF